MSGRTKERTPMASPTTITAFPETITPIQGSSRLGVLTPTWTGITTTGAVRRDLEVGEPMIFLIPTGTSKRNENTV